MLFMPITIRYRFSQNFAVSQKQAYLWCTDFTSQDPQFLGSIITERQVLPLSEGLILLKDVLRSDQSVVEKQKLVHLYPDKLSWVLTHITGQTKYSQFRYELLSDSTGCCYLNYEALHVEHEKDCLSSDEKLQLANALYKRDLDMWRLLAVAMEQEIK
jgi:hypothetical protein